MLTIRVIGSSSVSVYIVHDTPQHGEITLRPCLYCGEKLVHAPRKFCCDSHKARYSEKGIAHAQQ